MTKPLLCLFNVCKSCLLGEVVVVIVVVVVLVGKKENLTLGPEGILKLL